jgi:hypothetical protein
MARAQIITMEKRLLILHPWRDDQPILNWNTREHPVYDIPDALLERWLALAAQVDTIQRELSAILTLPPA